MVWCVIIQKNIISQYYLEKQMSILEQENKLQSLTKNREEFLSKVKQNCNLNDEDYWDLEAIESNILSGDLPLEWADHRDFEYISDMVECQQALIDTLKIAEKGDKKSLHNANKDFEMLVREARHIKRKRLEDVQKAQEAISFMEEIIEICDKHRNS